MAMFAFGFLFFSIFLLFLTIFAASWYKRKESICNDQEELDNLQYIFSLIIFFNIIISIILSMLTMTTPVTEETRRKEIVSSPNDGEYYNIYKNKIIYYTKTKEGTVSRKLDTEYIKEKFVLNSTESPYISYKVKYNIIGIEVDRSVYTIFLFKK